MKSWGYADSETHITFENWLTFVEIMWSWKYFVKIMKTSNFVDFFFGKLFSELNCEATTEAT